MFIILKCVQVIENILTMILLLEVFIRCLKFILFVFKFFITHNLTLLLFQILFKIKTFNFWLIIKLALILLKILFFLFLVIFKLVCSWFKILMITFIFFEWFIYNLWNNIVAYLFLKLFIVTVIVFWFFWIS